MVPRLKITMAARAVVAKGYEFSLRPGSFADADVALDEILSLPPPPEPLVLRVTATGGDAAERELVEGDWLCDGTRAEPRRIPAPVWTYSEDATAWAKARPWLEAWETCEDARWMLHAAAKVGVDRRLVVRAACACARTVLDRIPVGEERPRRAIEAAEAWTRGEATADAVQQGSDDAFAATADATTVASTEATASSASAAYTVTAASSASAAGFASYAADEAASAARAGSQRALSRLANRVRREIPTLWVLRAACGG